MYMHEEIILAVMPILEKSRAESEMLGEDPISLQDFIGELNHAAWEISMHSELSIKNFKNFFDELANKK